MIIMDSISEVQQDMRRSYYGGATGAACSATAWLAAASLVGLLALNPNSPWVGTSQRLIETSVWLWIVVML